MPAGLRQPLPSTGTGFGMLLLNKISNSCDTAARSRSRSCNCAGDCESPGICDLNRCAGRYWRTRDLTTLPAKLTCSDWNGATCRRRCAPCAAGRPVRHQWRLAHQVRVQSDTVDALARTVCPAKRVGVLLLDDAARCAPLWIAPEWPVLGASSSWASPRRRESWDERRSKEAFLASSDGMNDRQVTRTR